MTGPSSRDDFFDRLRRSLGRVPGTTSVTPEEATALLHSQAAVDERASQVKKAAGCEADALMSRLEESANQAGWKVARVASVDEAGVYIQSLVRDLEAHSIVRSAHAVLGGIDLEALLEGTGVDLQLMALGDGTQGEERDARRRELRERAIEADVGVTGVDYAIAETGTCVLLARKGVSRLVSLLPPVHVAVVERGQVLPSLDELFTLYGHELQHGSPASYMSLITGPSRSADIEYTLVTGVHGPGEVHMVLVG